LIYHKSLERDVWELKFTDFCKAYRLPWHDLS